MTSNWIEWKWTEEKPYPETLDTRLSMLRFADGMEQSTISNVELWHADEPHSSNWYNADGSPVSIVAYKVAK